MFGASIFGTTPYAGLLTYRYLKPASEKVHKLLFVPVVNMGADTVGRSTGELFVPGVNTGTGLFGPDAGKILYVPGINTGSETIPEA